MKYKALCFLPLAFLAGTHGFALFAPYVGVVLAALHLRARSRERTRAREKASAGGAVLPSGPVAIGLRVPAPVLA
jgi:hypothetical protein